MSEWMLPFGSSPSGEPQADDGVEPAKGWNLRGGIQLPVTSAKEVDYSLIVILTKGF